MSELSDIIRSPLEDDESMKSFLIMTGLTFLSFLVVPLFILAGYYAKTASHRGKGLPPVESYKDLLVTGLKVWAGYILLFMAIIAVIITTSGIELFAGEVVGLNSLVSEAAAFMFLLTGALTLAFYRPAMVVGIGLKASFRDGFSRRTISRCLTADYILAWLAVYVAGLVVSTVQIILFFTIVGIVLLPITHVYGKLITWRLFGKFLELEQRQH